MVRVEGEAHHVDWLHADVLDVPCRMDFETERVMQVGAYAFDGDGQITLRSADQENVVHVEQHVRDEPSGGGFACPAVHALLA